VCAWVADPAVPGTSLEACVTKDTGDCVPACQLGSTCRLGKCIADVCDPACTGGRLCDGGACVVHPLGMGCPQLLDCVAECASSDDPCVSACLDLGNAPGRRTYETLQSCAQGAGCADTPCLEAACAEQLAACLGLAPPSLCDPACGPGQACLGGICVVEGGALCDPPCLPDEACQSGLCVPAGGGCGDIDARGACAEDLLVTCEGGELHGFDCSSGGAGCTCRFSTTEQRNTCLCGP
jgi:hypothetical protein